ncbi:MAG: hypothetical protein AAF549_08730 [Pseudomonadota bacterium]
MHWQRLNRDDSVKTIDSVKSDMNAGLFNVATSEVKRARVPFYKSYQVYQITNFASLPSFSFQYLGDGKFFQHLDGTESPIYVVNDKGDLSLSIGTVQDYLEFFFTNVGDEDGDIVLITNPKDMPLLDSLDMDVYQAVFSQHKPIHIEDKESLGFLVEADLYKESQLVRAKIEISPKGRVNIAEQKMIIHQMLDSSRVESVL